MPAAMLDYLVSMVGVDLYTGVNMGGYDAIGERGMEKGVDYNAVEFYDCMAWPASLVLSLKFLGLLDTNIVFP